MADYLGIGVPWTLKLRPDNTTLRRKAEAKPIDYPKADGVLTFDRLSSVFVSNTNHEEDQPVHLTLKDPDIPTAINLPVYAGPSSVIVPQAFMNLSKIRPASRGFRSMPRIAFTAKPATSRIRPRTSTGSVPKEAEVQIIRTCSLLAAVAWAALAATPGRP